ncbi:hypothetical protein CPB84DRAFT_1744696 [Gymnopilus junonius]|uniref:Uncharacterized protein n=1 Tax=Gymnopilus junonius TaxID=109634 RepID=A0A9P5NXM9_GYMJU|nr:hypothetical protein CPB84DRAFT_1744696 [Gymnopilus junonius]
MHFLPKPTSVTSHQGATNDELLAVASLLEMEAGSPAPNNSSRTFDAASMGYQTSSAGPNATAPLASTKFEMLVAACVSELHADYPAPNKSSPAFNATSMGHQESSASFNTTASLPSNPPQPFPVIQTSAESPSSLKIDPPFMFSSPKSEKSKRPTAGGKRYKQAVQSGNFVPPAPVVAEYSDEVEDFFLNSATPNLPTPPQQSANKVANNHILTEMDLKAFSSQENGRQTAPKLVDLGEAPAHAIQSTRQPTPADYFPKGRQMADMSMFSLASQSWSQISDFRFDLPVVDSSVSHPDLATSLTMSSSSLSQVPSPSGQSGSASVMGTDMSYSNNQTWPQFPGVSFDVHIDESCVSPYTDLPASSISSYSSLANALSPAFQSGSSIPSFNIPSVAPGGCVSENSDGTFSEDAGYGIYTVLTNDYSISQPHSLVASNQTDTLPAFNDNFGQWQVLYDNTPSTVPSNDDAEDEDDMELVATTGVLGGIFSVNSQEELEQSGLLDTMTDFAGTPIQDQSMPTAGLYFMNTEEEQQQIPDVPAPGPSYSVPVPRDNFPPFIVPTVSDDKEEELITATEGQLEGFPHRAGSTPSRSLDLLSWNMAEGTTTNDGPTNTVWLSEPKDQQQFDADPIILSEQNIVTNNIIQHIECVSAAHDVVMTSGVSSSLDFSMHAEQNKTTPLNGMPSQSHEGQQEQSPPDSDNIQIHNSQEDISKELTEGPDVSPSRALGTSAPEIQEETTACETLTGTSPTADVKMAVPFSSFTAIVVDDKNETSGFPSVDGLESPIARAGTVKESAVDEGASLPPPSNSHLGLAVEPVQLIIKQEHLLTNVGEIRVSSPGLDASQSAKLERLAACVQPSHISPKEELNTQPAGLVTNFPEILETVEAVETKRPLLRETPPGKHVNKTTKEAASHLPKSSSRCTLYVPRDIEAELRWLLHQPLSPPREKRKRHYLWERLLENPDDDGDYCWKPYDSKLRPCRYVQKTEAVVGGDDVSGTASAATVDSKACLNSVVKGMTKKEAPSSTDPSESGQHVTREMEKKAESKAPVAKPSLPRPQLKDMETPSSKDSLASGQQVARGVEKKADSSPSKAPKAKASLPQPSSKVLETLLDSTATGQQMEKRVEKEVNFPSKAPEAKSSLPPSQSNNSETPSSPVTGFQMPRGLKKEAKSPPNSLSTKRKPTKFCAQPKSLLPQHQPKDSDLPLSFAYSPVTDHPTTYGQEVVKDAKYWPPTLLPSGPKYAPPPVDQQNRKRKGRPLNSTLNNKGNGISVTTRDLALSCSSKNADDVDPENSLQMPGAYPGPLSSDFSFLSNWGRVLDVVQLPMCLWRRFWA